MKISVLHGWEYSTDGWGAFIDTATKKGFDVEVLEIPGLTESAEHSFDIDGYVKWLTEKVGKKQVDILVAHSNGARIAVAFVSKYPDIFRSLVLISPAGVINMSFWNKVKRLLLKIFSFFAKLIPASIKDFLRQKVGSRDYVEASKDARVTMKNMLAVNILEYAEDANIPTLVMSASDDKITPFSDSEKIVHSIVGSKIIKYGTGGHYLHETRPADVVEGIMSWVKDL